ncbi:MAG: lamin tail domain-containing protein, partial [Planctomycetes bacterium]|nr:lamin tail domain-containing protein [Planctomycetota bacterium]
ALYGPFIETDVEEAMYGENASAYVRVPFNVADPGAYTSLALRMMYDDGFVAYLNGVEVARRNAAPGTPAWNAQAAGAHAGAPATSYEDIDVTAHLGLLQAGTNVLAIHGLNAAADDDAFLILPELAQITSLGLTPHYFATPTPGWANSGAFVAYVADTEFSVDRGFYDAPFDLEITSDTPLATIYYTTDGTLPGPTNGTVYTAPIPILTTSVIRAVAVREGWEPSDVDTQTYIFLGDVLQQTRPDDYPTSWGPATADYDVDADVVNNPAYHDTILDDLRSLPTMSIVMDWEDIFGPMGIYSNSWAEGALWERACSVEYIEIDGSTGFQENAGIRIYGGVSRDPSVKQHSLRLLFKAEYGATKLQYPLFEGSQVEQFDTITLRGNFNDGWGPMSFGGGSAFIRDQWARDVQLAMGQPAMDGTYVHLYINGLYWGLYNPAERADASFLAEHLGGEKEDYDAINSGEAIDGDMTAWNTMMRIANTGHADAGWAYDPNALASAGAYALLRQYCDVDNLIDYILLNFYSGNGDWDGHNWYAGRKREAGAGFKFFSWDHEWALSGLYDDVTGRNTDGCPTRVFQQLRANAEFRLLVADHIQRHYFSGGPLTPEGSAALWQARVDQIYDAMVGESARWGDMVNEPALTRDGNWLPVQEWFLDSYFPNRSAIAFQQIVNMDLYPRLGGQIFAAPEFNYHGGTVPYGFDVTIAAPQGTIYYTLDGTDPRVTGGAVAPGTLVYGGAIDLTRNTLIKCRAYSGGTWSALTAATFVLDNAPDLRVTEIMYHPAPPTTAEAALGFTDEDAFEFLELRNVGDTVMDLSGFRFGAGIDFAFPAMTLAPGAYALVVADQAAFEARYGTALAPLIVGEFAAGRLANEGERLSLEAAVGGLIHDFKYNDTWYDHTDGGGFSLVVRDDAADLALWGSKDTWRASAAAGGSPGAADVGYDPGSVIVSEILAHSDGVDGDWIELHNTTGGAITIGGWFLSDSAGALASYRIAPGTVLGGGQYLVLTQAANFGVGATDPGRLVGFGLSELGGEAVYLTSADPSGAPGGYRVVQPFGASDREVAFGLYSKSTGGTDFVAMITPTPWGPNDLPAVGPVVINEIMYHPETGGYEFIELLNL